MPILIALATKRSPLRHIQAMIPALLTAFSSASSAATLPLTMECVQKRSGVSTRTSSFVLPLGATVNMDGTALYECVAAMFIAQAYGLDLSLTTQFMIVITALLTSIGVASIPAASLVAITVILGAIGLPAEAIGLILVTDRVLDNHIAHQLGNRTADIHLHRVFLRRGKNLVSLHPLIQGITCRPFKDIIQLINNQRVQLLRRETRQQIFDQPIQ